MLVGMFERFTDRARRVLVLAQEEARLFGHGFIGTEHILLGLVREGDGVAAKALETLGIDLVGARREVLRTLGPQPQAPPLGSPPFTPRAKRVLELSLREALRLGHNYIGTEHVLLGLVREGEGVAAQVLEALGTDLPRVREQVIAILAGHPSPEAAEARGWISAEGLGGPVGGWTSYAPLAAQPRWHGTLSCLSGAAPGTGLAGVVPAVLMLGVRGLLWSLAARGATRRSWRASLAAAVPLAALDVAISAGARRGRLPTVSPPLHHHAGTERMASAVCSFCSTETSDVIAGPGGFICWSCVRAATTALAGRPSDDGPSQLIVVGAEHLGAPCSFCDKPPVPGLAMVTGSGQTDGVLRICRECIELCEEVIATRGAD